MARKLTFYNSYATLADGTTTGAELVATDGTAAGTFLVQDIRAGSPSSDPTGITPLRAGGVIFTASDGPSLGKQLFVSDGTANGTVELVGAFIPVSRVGGSSGATNSSLADLTPFGAGALFAGATAGTAVQLWITDGTFAGTRALRDFAPSPSVTLDGITDLGNGRAVLDVGAGAAEPGLWSTDGTTGGTVRLSAAASRATAIGRGLALTQLDTGSTFSTTTPRTNMLGVTDGTAAGTRTLMTFSSFLGAPVPTVFPLGDGRALFVAGNQANANYDLWVTDGTAGGTVRLLGPPTNSMGQAVNLGPANLTQLGNRVLFSGNNGSGGATLWTTDGTQAGTVAIASLSAGGATAFTPLGDGRLLFGSGNGTGGTDIWITDGTAAGTLPLADTAAGTRGGTVASFVPFAPGRALFLIVDYNTGASTVWATDGTVAGTVPLLSVPRVAGSFGATVYPVGGLAPVPGNRAVFAVDQATGSSQIYATDGTAAGTGVIATVATKPGFSPSASILPNGDAAFNTITPAGLGASYITDGTAAGTVRSPLLLPSASTLSFAAGRTAVAIGSDAAGPAAPPSPDPLFDNNYYLAHNPDVTASGINPYQHYVALGGREGRNPDAFFDSKYYLQQNPDVAAAGVNPLLHYEQYGAQEGRDPSLLFSTRSYLAANPDVAAAGVNPLLHFIQHGQAENRASPLPFSSTVYDPLADSAYLDPQLGATLIPGSFGGAAQAFAIYDQKGWKLGLNPDAFFNTNYYLAHNPDVAASGLNPLVHFEQFGWKEGRDPSAGFSTSKYLAANPDVARAGVDPLLQYVQSGQAEGRAIYPA